MLLPPLVNVRHDHGRYDIYHLQMRERFHPQAARSTSFWSQRSDAVVVVVVRARRIVGCESQDEVECTREGEREG